MFKNLKIRVKLLIGFEAVALLVLVTGLIGLSETNTIKGQAAISDAAKDLNITLMGDREALRRYLLTEDPDKLIQLKVEIEEYDEFIEMWIEALSHGTDSAEFKSKDVYKTWQEGGYEARGRSVAFSPEIAETAKEIRGYWEEFEKAYFESIKAHDEMLAAKAEFDKAYPTEKKLRHALRDIIYPVNDALLNKLYGEMIYKSKEALYQYGEEKYVNEWLEDIKTLKANITNLQTRSQLEEYYTVAKIMGDLNLNIKQKEADCEAKLAVVGENIAKVEVKEKEIESVVIDTVNTVKARATFLLLTVILFTLILGLGIGFFLSASLSRFITQVRNAAVEIARGNMDVKIDTSGGDEIAELSQAIDEMRRNLKATMEKYEKTDKELKTATMELIQSEKLKALGELMASIAHELNQPLNVTKIICQSILRDIQKGRYEQEGANKDLPEIMNQMNKMAEIIDHMRVFTRRTGGVVKETVDVNLVIKGALKFLGQQLKNHNIELIKQLTPDLPKVTGDPIRLEQVFLNLISNARNAVDNCGKENKKMEIKTFPLEDQKSLAVEVTDNDGGIPENLREKIFEPFFTTKKPGEGTGLGLSVAKKIIEEHQGRIELESQVGEGSTFRVILPIKE